MSVHHLAGIEQAHPDKNKDKLLEVPSKHQAYWACNYRGVQIIRNSSHKKKGYIWAKFCVFSYSIILRTNGIDKL